MAKPEELIGTKLSSADHYLLGHRERMTSSCQERVLQQVPVTVRSVAVVACHVPWGQNRGADLLMETAVGPTYLQPLHTAVTSEKRQTTSAAVSQSVGDMLHGGHAR